MNHPPATPSFGQALAWAFQRLNEEMRVVLVLSALLAVVMLVALWPLYGYYVELFAALTDSRLNPAGIEAIEAPAVASIFSIFVSMAGACTIYVLLARLTDLDHAALLAGGLRGLAKRALWIVWRLICAFALIMIVAVAIMMVTVFITILLATVASHDFAVQGLASLIVVGLIAFYAVMLVVFLAIYGALAVSIYAASRDIRIGIFASWNALEGCRRHLLLANGAIYLALVAAWVPVALLSGALFAVIGGFAVVVYAVLGSLIAGVYAFLWLGVGAAFANYALARS